MGKDMGIGWVGGLGGRDLRGRKMGKGSLVKGEEEREGKGVRWALELSHPEVPDTQHCTQTIWPMLCVAIHLTKGEQSTKYRLPGRTSGCRL